MANYLTFPTENSMEGVITATVNGTVVTSPYTLQDGDQVVVTLYNENGYNPETDSERTVFSLNGEELTSIDNAWTKEVADDDITIAFVDDYWKGTFTLNVAYTETMLSVKCTSTSGVILATEKKYCETNVKVKPTLEEITITPGAKQIVTTSDGYGGIGKVTVSKVSTQTKTVAPTKESQTLIPSNGKYFSKVTVKAIPDNYIEPSGTTTITENGTVDVTSYASAEVDVASIKEVATEGEMTALLVKDNLGKVYRYTGTTGTYINGDLYEVEVV